MKTTYYAWTTRKNGKKGGSDYFPLTNMKRVKAACEFEVMRGICCLFADAVNVSVPGLGKTTRELFKEILYVDLFEMYPKDLLKATKLYFQPDPDETTYEKPLKLMLRARDKKVYDKRSMDGIKIVLAHLKVEFTSTDTYTGFLHHMQEGNIEYAIRHYMLRLLYPEPESYYDEPDEDEEETSGFYDHDDCEEKEEPEDKECVDEKPDSDITRENALDWLNHFCDSVDSETEFDDEEYEEAKRNLKKILDFDLPIYAIPEKKRYPIKDKGSIEWAFMAPIEDLDKMNLQILFFIYTEVLGGEPDDLLNKMSGYAIDYLYDRVIEKRIQDHQMYGYKDPKTEEQKYPLNSKDEVLAAVEAFVNEMDLEKCQYFQMRNINAACVYHGLNLKEVIEYYRIEQLTDRIMNGSGRYGMRIGSMSRAEVRKIAEPLIKSIERMSGNFIKSIEDSDK